ncbi:MAG TPA: hypothetical protein VFV35_01565 [Acidimicrobiales bacterium]|nr:hypothetical protein [Acidimicrobiales bacterium]
MSEVKLVDLDIIKRYSLAIRQETAPAEDLLAALDASRAVVAAALGKAEPAGRPPSKSAKKAAR